MAKTKNKRSEKELKPSKKEIEPSFIGKRNLADETIHTIWALVSIAFAILLALAGFHQAGVVGESIFSFLKTLFGWGYILLPITLVGVSLNLLIHRENRLIYIPTIWGSFLFFLAGLGFIDVISDGSGGICGGIIGYIKVWIGDVAASVILLIVAIIGIVIAFDHPIKLNFSKKEKLENKNIIQPEPIVTGEQEPVDTKKKKGLPEEKESEKIDLVKESFGNIPIPNKTKGVITKIADYKAPPLELLKTAVEKPSAGDLHANANIIKRTLESFGIAVDMGEINIGPKVTRFTLRPAEGVKLSRITALNQDLALALSAHPIRIEAPIPGKPYVGIEVPNKTAAVVRLGNLISYPDFTTSGALGFCIGRDVTGDPIFSNIEKMPHLLIAGATGSGKSIMLHSVLISLLYKNSPQMMKLILIDPKRVELTSYNGLPHLIAPVVIQGKKALGVFRWAINEMDHRYETLMKVGARDIQSYNKKKPEEPLPFIVIVVDEMADLMASYGRDVENAIVRLAQMARATGIHLILSTQRPSVEVITGLIKANITSRIALQVASQIDSRTILDTAGAEKLLGGGDLLYVSAQLSKPKRIQGAFISEDEIKAVTDYIKENNQDLIIDEDTGLTFDAGEKEGEEPSSTTSNENREFERGKSPFDSFEDTEDEDDMLEEAIEVVKEAQKASASLLQRRLKVGYARAARLLDIMEDKQLIGPGDGAKAREVYIAKDTE
ncbi:MAG: DNA translocase FtsK [Candidatus Paceibacterota bacterium]